MGDMLGLIKGALVNHVVRNVKKMVPSFSLPDSVRFNDAVAQGRKMTLNPARVGPDDIAVLQYTGGTTGVSKGAVLLHRNLVANLLQSQAWYQPALKKIPPGEQIVTVCALPLYHIFGFNTNMMLSLLMGGCNILIANPRDIAGVLKELSRHKFHSFPAVNTLFNALVNHPDFDKVDWSSLKNVEAEAATHLSELFRHWAGEALEMRWLSGEHFLAVLSDAAPTGVRDADPAYWALRLDALRLANRPDQFDEAAIDYCMTYEVSPPSWERTRCQVRIGGSGLSTQSPPLSQVGEVATTFLESSVDEHTGTVTMASVELAGQLVGDIGATLKQLDTQLAAAPMVTVSCAKLIRVDFIAAGDLLNWVLSKRGENRSVTFAEAHRLVALFFGAMGINEHASVRVKNL